MDEYPEWHDPEAILAGTLCLMSCPRRTIITRCRSRGGSSPISSGWPGIPA